MKHVSTVPMALLLLVLALPIMAQSDFTKADKEYELHAYNRAVNSYLKVLKPDSKNANAMGRLADAYRHLNQIDKALVWYERAAKLPRVNPMFILQYGKALMNAGQYEKAKEWFAYYAEGQPDVGNHYIANCDFAIAMRGVTPLYKVKREFLNTQASEFGAAILGDKVVYSSSRTDIKRKNLEKNNSDWLGEKQSQLYLTSRDNNNFLRQPDFLHSDLRNKYGQGPVSYSPDGNWVAFTKNNFTEGTRQIPSSGVELSIYIAEVDNNGDWKDAKPFPFNGTGFGTGYPAFSPDGQSLYFASDRPDGFGGYDIYVTRKIGATWSSPENLGSGVNSTGNEITPFFDGTSLYFASDWHQGLGGFDVFRAEKENRKWGKIFHLGNGVNSTLDDYGYVFDNNNNLGYFTSNRKGGKGNEDIYQITKLTDIIEIVVTNVDNQQAIGGAKLDFSACNEPVFSTDDAGIYQFQALAGLDCEVIVSADGYESQTLQVLSSGKRDNKRYEVKLFPQTEPYIGNILDAKTNRPLDEVFIKATERMTGRVLEGQTGSTGTYRLNLRSGQSYDLRFSRAGYENFHFNVETGLGADRSILGVMRMQPSGTRIDNGSVVVNTSNSGTSNGSSSSNEDNSSTSTTASTEDGAGSAVPPGTSLSEKAEEVFVAKDDSKVNRYSDLDKGYAVQLAALPKDFQIKSSVYSNVESVGNLYSRSEKGMQKVRVGIFATRKEASEARKQAVKKGYDKAFVVVETLEDMDEVDFLNQVPGSGVSDSESRNAAPEASAKKASPYKVQLAAYKNPQFFEANKVKGLGKLERRRRGDLTIMLLGGFGSLQEALQASKAAVRQGFEGAYVVIDEKTRLVRVNP